MDDGRLRIRGGHGGFSRTGSLDRAAHTEEAFVSTRTFDRYHSILEPYGWRLDNYRKNPVVCWSHMDWELPIGRNLNLDVQDLGLLAKSEFAVGVSRRADEIWALKSAGFGPDAYSVGWIPLEWEEFKLDQEDGKGPVRGVRYITNELLEYSLVTVPGNPDALALSVAGLVANRAMCRGFSVPRPVLPEPWGSLANGLLLAAEHPEIVDVEREALESENGAAMRRYVADIQSSLEAIGSEPTVEPDRLVTELERLLQSL